MTLGEILFQVQKPGRYLGNELNSMHKDPGGMFRAVIAYPDLYEIGASNLGISILYHRLNKEEDIWCERAFAPGPDLEKALRSSGLPLFSLESRTPLRDFSLVGFSLQYELTFPQVLNMLELGKIPLRTAERGPEDPVVVAGGPCTANPEPMAPFFDALHIGDGEEAILEIVQTVKEFRGKKSRDRHELHLALSRIPGVYVPVLYEPMYSESGMISDWKIDKAAPWPVPVRRVRDLDSAYFPALPVLPGIEIVHDRAQVELFRGCVRGCRFCQAGFVYRPRRFRSPEKVVFLAREILKNTGWEELGLVSLSTCDYPGLEQVIEGLRPYLSEKKVQVSLPSLRADSFSVKMARLAQGNRITLTFAPEAGTQRLREVIGKDLSEEEIKEAIKLAAQYDFERVKLYFMVGLPKEEEEDLEEIVSLVIKLNQIAKSISRKVHLSVSCSAFVPKPQTPFQWERMEELHQLKRKRLFVRSKLEKRGIEVGGQKEELSFLEGVIARGDRKIAGLIEEAWKNGSRLDGWSDYFSFPVWQEAMSQAGIDPAFYLYREREKDEVLPWSGVRYAAGLEYLWQERERAYRG